MTIIIFVTPTRCKTRLTAQKCLKVAKSFRQTPHILDNFQFSHVNYLIKSDFAKFQIC